MALCGYEREWTCGDDAGEDPALSVFDGSLGVPETLENEHTALPFGGRFSALVIAGPVAFQHSVVIGRIHL